MIYMTYKIYMIYIIYMSTYTQRTYPIRQRLDCNSSFVVYLGTCQKCGGQYIGKSTTPFKKRHSNHKQEIKKQYGGLGHHYGGQGCGYPSVSIQLIEQVQNGDHEALARQEVYWQNQLRGYVQNGGHAHCYRKEKNSKWWRKKKKVNTQFYLTFSSSADVYLIDVIMSNYVQVWFHLGSVKQFI